MIDIVLIEDDCELRRMLKYLLSEIEGFEVEYFKDGSNALPFIEKNLPRLVLMDLQLPGMSGLEILKSIRAKLMPTPVVIITASDSELTEMSCLIAGANDYLAKPIRSSVLVERIKRQMSKKDKVIEVPTKTKIQPYLREIDHSLICNEININLAPSEYEIIDILNRNKAPMTVSELFEKIHGFNHDPSDRSIYMRISSLKKKISSSIPNFDLVRNRRSKGFYLSCEVMYL